MWTELRPDRSIDIQKVASKFGDVSNCQFIARFDKFLRKSVSHFTPSEEGAERLLIKYYQYILQLKKLLYSRYKMNIIQNADCFLDRQTQKYYNKIALKVEQCHIYKGNTRLYNYYIYRIKPFFVNNEIYYEVTLESADEKSNKFNRITAFTKEDIFTNYCVALGFIDVNIDVFDMEFPIKVITEWHVSIRPCEINNFAKILYKNPNIQRGHAEYKALMDYLKINQYSLLELIKSDDKEYDKIKMLISATTKNNHSVLFEIFDKSREIIFNNRQGKNVLLFLLNHMRNYIIRDQWLLINMEVYFFQKVVDHLMSILFLFIQENM